MLNKVSAAKRRERGNTPFRIFSKAPSYTFPRFLAANHINILRILRKTAKKILRILRSPCQSDSYKEEKKFPGRCPREQSMSSLSFILLQFHSQWKRSKSGKSFQKMRWNAQKSLEKIRRTTQKSLKKMHSTPITYYKSETLWYWQKNRRLKAFFSSHLTYKGGNQPTL